MPRKTAIQKRRIEYRRRVALILAEHGKGRTMLQIEELINDLGMTYDYWSIRDFLFRRHLIPNEHWEQAHQDNELWDSRVRADAARAEREAARSALEQQRLAKRQEGLDKKARANAERQTLAEAKRARKAQWHSEESKRQQEGRARNTPERREELAQRAPIGTRAASDAARERREKLIPLVMELRKAHGPHEAAKKLNEMGVSRERRSAGPWNKNAVIRLTQAAETAALKIPLRGASIIETMPVKKPAFW